MNRSIRKIRFLLLSCLAMATMLMAQQNVKAQNWNELLKDPNATFFDIQAAFYKEWAGKPYAKSQGYKMFKRWENFWEYRINPDGTFPKYADMWQSYQQYAQAPQHRAGGGSGGNWTPIGPFDYTLTSSWSAGIGRVQVVVEDPNNPNTLYVGAPDGGIWKSTDAGSNWTPLGDDMPVIGVSGVAVDYANSNIVYISTGDPDGGDTYSIGVWKSTDGGTTFNQVGSPGGSNLNRIMIDPGNSNRLFVTSSTGVWRSLDAGVNWTNVRSGNFDDMIFKPGDPQTIYASTNSAFWRSTDGGNNWTQTTTGLPSSGGRIQIAVTPANANYVYLLSAQTNNAFQGIYRSTNSGASFSARNTTTDIFNGSGQAYYDMAICVSSTDANTIFTGCLNVWKSTNGGSSLTQVNSWSSPSSAPYTHADIHYLRYYGGNFYCGSDGGVYRSTNDGTSFTDLTAGVQIGQFYTIAGTEQNPNVICGGLQDNGGYAWNGTEWKCYYGADGMESAVDENNSSLIFGMIQMGGLWRSTNGGNSVSNLGSPESGSWVTPMQSDPTADRLVAGYNDLYEYNYSGGWNQISTHNFAGILRKVELFPANTQIIYVASYNQLYKTTNGGTSFTNITGTLSTGSGITSIECHPTDLNRVWVTVGGSSGARVYYSADGGANWTNITGSLPNIPVNIIKFEQSTAEGLYIGADVGIYYRDNNTGDWVPFNNQLPNSRVTDLEINQTAGLIRAATYGRGVWSSGTYDQLTDNAGLTTVITPNGSLCDGNFVPEVTLINAGSNTLVSCDITYDIDGLGAQVFNWTGSLAQFSTTNVTLPAMSTTGGAHTFNAVVSNPNGIPDPDPSNDAVSSNFDVTIGGSPVTLLLNTDCWGSEVTWIVQDQTTTTVASGGPYGNVNGGELITEVFCLPDGCYTFIINDSFGDGLNGVPSGCSVNGTYTIEDELSNTLTSMIAVDGAYGSQEVNPFCLTTAVVADFSGTPTTICAGETVDFTDLSTGSPTGWSWTFTGGSPGTSSIQNPTGITYNTAGTYQVSLTASNSGSSDDEVKVAYITVNENPNVTNTSSTDETCTGNDGTATVTPGGGSGNFTYLWDASAGSQTTPTATGLAAGSYGVTVTDAVTGCNASTNVSVSNNCSVPTTMLRTNYCPSWVAPYLYSYFKCVEISGASQYEFRAVNAGLGYDETIVRSNKLCALSLFPGISYGYTYDITVRAYVGGNWGSFDQMCQVSSPATIPGTTLKSVFCPDYTIGPINQLLTCYEVPGATDYRFRAFNAGIGYDEIVPGRHGRNRISMYYFPNVAPNTTYEVSASAFVNGGWQPFGAACNITTGSSTTLIWLPSDGSTEYEPTMDEVMEMMLGLNDTEVFDMNFSIFPNPNDGNEVTIHIPEVARDKNVSIVLYDVAGKEVYREEVSGRTGMVYKTIRFNGRLGQGMYLVTVSSDGTRATQRLLIR